MSTPQQRALAVLTPQWQELPVLRTLAGFEKQGGAWGFADLAFEGKAQEKREPITRYRQPAGERIFYRLNPMKPTLQIFPATPTRSWKQHTLHTTAEEIERVLGFPANLSDDPDKVTHSWGFRVEGHSGEFAIWDYKGSAEYGEWSAFGDGAVLAVLFPVKP